MKKILPYISIVCCMALAACSDDTPTPFDPVSTLEQRDGFRVSYFDVDRNMIHPDALEAIHSANLKEGFRNLTSFPVEIRNRQGRMRLGLQIAAGTPLSDGVYLLTFSDEEGRPLPGALSISIEDEMVGSVSVAESSFTLRHGSGTESDPYIISSARDFVTFLDDLRENELTNGRDVWFRQTADITLMDQSSTKPGRGYFGYSFAGHYDGGGFELRDLYYRGSGRAESDSEIGIFPSLLDGATVSNLIISGINISGIYTDAGALAGTVVGNVSVSGITLQGSISAPEASNIGGLIGRLEKGTLRLSDLRMRNSVEGHSCVGGIIGKVDGGALTVSQVTTPDSHFSVDGFEECGGIAGSVSGGSVCISDITLTHVVSREDDDIRLVHTTGGNSCGGIVGSIRNVSSNISLTNLTVSCPVGGTGNTAQYIGGIAGQIESSRDVEISGLRFTSVVSGDKEVGGYAGHLRLTSGASLIVGGDSKTNYIVSDDSAAGIAANTSAGGAFGYLEAPVIKASSGAVRIGVNVETTGIQSGGAVGKLNLTSFNPAIFNMSSSTMTVSGREKVGGVIGIALNSTLTGESAFNFPMSGEKAVVPEASGFPLLYKGLVKGNTEVGGLIGRGENVTLKALAAGATVTGLGGNNIGGIAGILVTSGRDNRFEDLVSTGMVTLSSGENAGGIAGMIDCDDASYMTDCINYGRVAGSENTGGIIGYYYRHWKSSFSLSNLPIVTWSINQGEVSGATCVGGVIGKCYVASQPQVSTMTGFKILKTGNNGRITSGASNHSASGVGGILGYGEAYIYMENNSNNGYILSGASHKGVGGIAGSLGKDASGITGPSMNVQLYAGENTGTIDSQNSSTRVGGVLGFMEEGSASYVRNCRNLGRVLGKHNSDNGGIVGYVDHLTSIYDCVNLEKIDHGNATIGTHKTGSTFYHNGLYYLDGTGSSWPSATKVSQAEIGNKSKFPRLDFESIWGITSDGPYLKGCPF